MGILRDLLSMIRLYENQPKDMVTVTVASEQPSSYLITPTWRISSSPMKSSPHDGDLVFSQYFASQFAMSTSPDVPVSAHGGPESPAPEVPVVERPARAVNVGEL